MILDVFAISVIVILGFVPMVLSIWGIHTLSRHPHLYTYRSRRNNRAANAMAFADLNSPWSNQWSSLTWLTPEQYLGDTSCRFNAHSPFLRCAVNPSGPCQNCSSYEASAHLNEH